MKLTEEEKQIIIDKRKKEEEAKPKKTGILKHDLYHPTKMCFEGYDPNKTITYKLFLEIVENFKSTFVKIPKGTEFNCYIEDDHELWHNAETGYIEYRNSNWAKENLEKIKKL